MRAPKKTTLADFKLAVRQFNETLTSFSPSERKARMTAYALWWFIENVQDNDKGRNALFFKLREMVRELNEEK